MNDIILLNIFNKLDDIKESIKLYSFLGLPIKELIMEYHHTEYELYLYISISLKYSK